MILINCKTCSKEFKIKYSMEKYCSGDCRKVGFKESIKKYNKSKKGKDARKRYKEKNKNLYKERAKRYYSEIIKKKKQIHYERKESIYKCLVCSHQWQRVRWIKKKQKPQKEYYPFNCPKCLGRCWDFGDNIKCSICLKLILRPIIHHINGNHKDNRKDNRIPLCDKCHKAIHLIDFRNNTRKKLIRNWDVERINYIKEYQKRLIS